MYIVKKKRKEILVLIHIDLNIWNMILLCFEDVDIKMQ